LSYNSPDLLAAVDSVLRQTYGNIQYIIVDDGSEKFDKEALLEVALCLKEGKGVKKDKYKAANLLKQATEEGNSTAKSKLMEMRDEYMAREKKKKRMKKFIMLFGA